MGYKGYKFIFLEGTGVIPPNSACLCLSEEEEYLWVIFNVTILGRKEIKIHHSVLDNHAIRM